MTENDNPEEEDESTTKSAKTRADWLSTVVAMILVVHYVVLITAGVSPMVDLSDIPQAWWFVDSTAFGTAVVYTFGPGALEAWTEITGGK